MNDIFVFPLTPQEGAKSLTEKWEEEFADFAAASQVVINVIHSI